MDEFKLYIRILKEIVDRNYGKEIIFYDDGKWYSREHCRYLSQQEFCDWVLELVAQSEEDYDYDDTLPCGCCACCGCSCHDKD